MRIRIARIIDIEVQPAEWVAARAALVDARALKLASLAHVRADARPRASQKVHIGGSRLNLRHLDERRPSETRAHAGFAGGACTT
jgi:hypothetical protein